MSQNLTLYNLRVERGLSLKTVAYQTLTNRLALYMYERGYLPIPQSKIALFAAFYGVKKEVFSDPLGYPTPIFPESKKPSFAEKMGKFLFRLPVLFASIGLLLASAGVLTGGLVTLNNVTVSHQAAGPDYAMIYNVVNEKGTSSELDDLLNKGTSKALTYSDESTGASFVVSISTKTQNYFKATFSAGVPLNDGTFLLTLGGNGESPYLQGLDMTTGLPSYILFGTFTNSEYVEVTSVQTILLQDVDEATAEAEVNLAAEASKSYDALYQKWLDYAGISPNVGIYDILVDAGQCGLNTEKLNNTGNNLTLVGSICLAIFFFFTVFISVALIAKKRKKAPASKELPFEDLPSRHGSHPLPKNWAVRPFLPEYLLRLVGIGLILTSSIFFFKTTFPVLNSLDITKIYGIIADAKTWYKFMPLVTMAMLLWFFTKVEMIQNKSYNPAVSIISMAACSILYYVTEISLSSYFGKGGDSYYASLYLVFSKFMPGNLPAAILSYTLIVLFLLRTPSFIHPKKVVWWRLLALLPIGYLALSYFYAFGVRLQYWEAWPYWASSLLVRKQFALITFAIFYPTLLYFYRLIIKKRYGPEQAPLAFEGNQYFFIKNLLACLIVTGIILANELLNKTTYAKAIGVASNLWLIVLIPLILFYHPHIGKRNSIADAGITVIYFVSLSFAYVYVGYFVLFPLRALLPI